MNEFRSLVLNCSDDFGMAVARCYNGNSSGEIQKKIAVNILDHRTAAPCCHQGITTRVGRRHNFMVEIENPAGIGSRQGGPNAGKLCFGNGRHPTSRETNCNSNANSSLALPKNAAVTRVFEEDTTVGELLAVPVGGCKVTSFAGGLARGYKLFDFDIGRTLLASRDAKSLQFFSVIVNQHGKNVIEFVEHHGNSGNV